MHSSWSFTAGVVLLSTCSAKALIPRGEPECSVVPHVYYPKVINTCCDKATTITVDECSTEIVLPTGGCIDTTITQIITKEHHHEKTTTVEPTSTSYSSTSESTSTATATLTDALNKRAAQQGGRSGDFYNRRRPWQDLNVYNPTFQGKNFDSDGNGDNRGNKVKVTDKSTTKKLDNSRIIAVDESGDYRDNKLKYNGGTGNGDGSMYNTGEDSGNNRDKGDYRDNDLKYFDASKENKVDVDVNKNKYANKKIDLKNSGNSGSQNSLKKSNNLLNSANQASQNKLNKELELKNSGNSGSQNSLRKDDSKHVFKPTSTDDHSKGGNYAIANKHNVGNDGNGNRLTKVDSSRKKIDVDSSVSVVKLENYRNNKYGYQSQVNEWYKTGLLEFKRCLVDGQSDDPGFNSVALNQCIRLPIGMIQTTAGADPIASIPSYRDIILGAQFETRDGFITIDAAVLEALRAELEQAGLDEVGLPYNLPLLRDTPDEA